MAFHKAPKECNVLRSNPLACQVPDSIMRRGLGLLIWMVVSFRCIYSAFWAGGNRQTGYIFSWRCARIGCSSVSRKSNRLCLHVLSYGTRDGLDGHPHVPNQTEENPSKLKLHILNSAFHVHNPYGFLTSGRSQAPSAYPENVSMDTRGADEAQNGGFCFQVPPPGRPEIRKRILG
jgi:hypothetical protein